MKIRTTYYLSIKKYEKNFNLVCLTKKNEIKTHKYPPDRAVRRPHDMCTGVNWDECVQHRVVCDMCSK